LIEGPIRIPSRTLGNETLSMHGRVRGGRSVVAGEKFGEPVMTLTEAAGWLERRFGRRPNVATVWRWATRGMKGVRLATISLGRFRYTTEAALERFIHETSLAHGSCRQSKDEMSAASRDAVEPRFTRSEIDAARKRRNREKSKAVEFLRSHMGTGAATKGRRPAAGRQVAARAGDDKGSEARG
jgi:hypothetical protein